MDDGNCSMTEDVELYDGPIYDEDDWEDDDNKRAVEELTEEQRAEIREREEQWIALTDCSLAVQAIVAEYSGRSI